MVQIASETDPIESRQIAQILPHRYPFLLVDRVISLNLEEQSIVGLKNVTANEPFFQGHFPDQPIMPGVLIIEALAQTAGLLMHELGFHGMTALFLSIRDAKFRRPVRPGDTLYLMVKALHAGHHGNRVLARALLQDDQTAVEAELSFALVEKHSL
jgi:3-hydroxyacyl-[acyl-carrier-protein] dehydratase